MIASVVAALKPTYSKEEVLAAIASLPGIEVGDSEGNRHRVPLVIDVSSPDDMEAVTEQLRRCPGVVFVDVVFVHFEDSGTISRDTLTAGGNQA